MDFQKKYLDTILGFIGLTDVVSIIAEPTLASGPDAAQDALKRAIATAQAVEAL
jgi:FMN-dependent NADH-azoreductase